MHDRHDRPTSEPERFETRIQDKRLPRQKGRTDAQRRGAGFKKRTKSKTR